MCKLPWIRNWHVLFKALRIWNLATRRTKVIHSAHIVVSLDTPRTSASRLLDILQVTRSTRARLILSMTIKESLQTLSTLPNVNNCWISYRVKWLGQWIQRHHSRINQILVWSFQLLVSLLALPPVLGLYIQELHLIYVMILNCLINILCCQIELSHFLIITK